MAIKTNYQDVVNTFKRYFGRDPNEIDTKNLNYLTQLAPQDVEARLKATAPKPAIAKPVPTPKPVIPVAPAPTPAPVDPNKNLFTQYGQTGVNLGDAISMYKDQYGVSQDEKANIYKDLGLTDLAQNAFNLPSFDTETLYNQKYNELGLSDVKSKIDTLLTQYNAKKDALNKEMGDVNENPWLPEASRIGRAKRLQELASGDISNLEAQINNLQNLYNDGKNEIANYITGKSNDFTNNQNINRSKLEYLTKQAEQKIADLEKQKEAEVYRYIPDYLTGTKSLTTKKTATNEDAAMLKKGYNYVNTPALRDQLKAKGYNIQVVNGRTYAKEPKLTTKTVKSGKTTYLITYADGKEIKREVVGGGGGLQNTSTNKNTPSDGYPKGFWAAIKAGVSSLQKGEKWGTVWNRVKTQFKGVKNEDIDKALGPEWRDAGAFEKYKQAQYKQSNPAKYQQQAGVWSWLATPEAQGMSAAQKKQEIMGAGFNPDDFGIY